ncbi:MAG: T9SS type A sorting domain-containing protein, partial [Bacteroidota bacterium]
LDVGINQISKNNPLGMAVWPNPFTNQINFAANNLNSVSLTDVKIIDVLGKTIIQTNYNHKSELNETLDLSGLSAGMYFINITNNNNQSVYRIIKK